MNGGQSKLGPILAQAKSLRAVHVNRPLDLGSEDVPMIARDQILGIVKQSGPNLMQFGYNTRVFQVCTPLYRACRTPRADCERCARSSVAYTGERTASWRRKRGWASTKAQKFQNSFLSCAPERHRFRDTIARIARRHVCGRVPLSPSSPESVVAGSSGEIEVRQTRPAAL